MRNRTRMLLRWGAAVLTVAVLLVMVRAVPWDRTLETLRSSDRWWLTAAALLNLVSLVTKGIAWWLFLRPAGLTSPREALRASFVGAALNDIVPWNLGDVGRVAVLVDEASVPVGVVTGAFALERATTALSAVLLVAVALPRVRLPFAAGSSGRLVVALVLLVGIVVLVAWRPSASSSGRTAAWRARLGLNSVSPTTLTVAMALGVAGWLAQLACYHLVALSVGLDVSIWTTVAILVACNLGFIVRLTPGGIGIFQVAYTATAVALGLPQALALASALLVQVVQIAPVMLVGAVIAPWPWREKRAARDGRAA